MDDDMIGRERWQAVFNPDMENVPILGVLETIVYRR